MALVKDWIWDLEEEVHAAEARKKPSVKEPVFSPVKESYLGVPSKPGDIFSTSTWRTGLSEVQVNRLLRKQHQRLFKQHGRTAPWIPELFAEKHLGGPPPFDTNIWYERALDPGHIEFDEPQDWAAWKKGELLRESPLPSDRFPWEGSNSRRVAREYSPFEGHFLQSSEPVGGVAGVGQGRGGIGKIRAAFGRIPPSIKRGFKWAGGIGLSLGAVWLYNKITAKDDAWNTIEGMSELGLAAQQRKILTDFGSGYKGPNPWLSPDYNYAQEVPHYKLMRASQLGKTQREMVQYFTQPEDPSEFLLATSSAGQALHLIEEARAAGTSKGVEQLVYDPTNQITGHIDIIDKEGRPVDIKSLAPKRMQYVRENGAFPRHMSQLNFYMSQLGAESGTLEYINRENRNDRLSVTVPFDPERLQRDLAKLEAARSEVEVGIASGKYNASSLPMGASLETLRAGQAEDAASLKKNRGRPDYLEKIYSEEMAYLHSLESARISGRDDTYNTITGMQEGGTAAALRKASTDFGSGYRGLFMGALLATDDVALYLARTGRLDDLGRYLQQVVMPRENAGYQTIEGLHPGNRGMATQIIRGGTPFGSKIDRVKQFAQMAGQTIEDFTGSSLFRTALKEAETIGVLGKGAYGEVLRKRTTLMGEAFDFVEKSPIKYAGKESWKNSEVLSAFHHEAATLHALSSSPASPTFYGLENNKLYMEYIQGVTASSAWQQGGKQALSLGKEAEGMLRETISAGASKGFIHGDPHGGNVLLNESGQAFIIDWGKTASIKGKSIAAETERSFNQIKSVQEFASLTPILRRPPSLQHIEGMASGGMAHVMRPSPFKSPGGWLTRAFGSLFSKKGASVTAGAIGRMSREEFANVLVRSPIEKSTGESLYSLLTKRSEYRLGGAPTALGNEWSGWEAGHKALHESAPSMTEAVRAGDLTSGGIRSLPNDKTWRRYAVGSYNDLTAKAGTNAEKAYFTFKSPAQDFSPKTLHEYIQGLHQAGFRGQIKLPQQASEVATTFDNLVVHGLESKDTQLAIKMGKAHFGKKAAIETGLDTSASISRTEQLARDIRDARAVNALSLPGMKPVDMASLAQTLRKSQKQLSLAAIAGGKGHLHPSGKSAT